MCGKAYDPRFIFAWPTAKIAVMGGDSAAKTLLQIQIAADKAKGRSTNEQEEKRILEEIKEKYQKQTTPYYAAARLWVDEIIDPLKTRQVISESLKACSNTPANGVMNTGVFQV